MQTYLFYDIETTGLSKVFDQVLHFAAIRTDMNLREIERYEIKIKLNSDVIPSPAAMITHRMRCSELAKGTHEYDAINHIHQWMNHPGTISIGYNTLSFDDEFLRFSFYRNLLPPYTHQFANQCSRMDIYPMVIMYFLFKPSILKWPERNGKISLKLENLNHENQWVKGISHHAMVDVEITLALAKTLMEEHDIWHYLCGYFDKKTDQERLKKSPSDIRLMVLGKLGADQHFQRIVLSLGTHHHYRNQSLWLQLDHTDFSQSNLDTLLPLTRVLSKKWGEPGFLLPLEKRFIHHLSEERINLAKANEIWLQHHPDLLLHITNYYRHYQYPIIPETDIDARLYLNGFWSEQDISFCETFSQAEPKKKSSLIDTMKNPNISLLALRILGRHFPDALSQEQARQFATYMEKVNPLDPLQALMDFKGNKRLTPHVAREQLNELRQQFSANHDTLELLDELDHELQKRFTL